MIVRVPDYFSEFSCIAGDCKDSCCLGWEIDIDEDSYEYYQTLPGEVGERLRKGMYETEDGGHGIPYKQLRSLHHAKRQESV